jgi:hypothetical protein
MQIGVAQVFVPLRTQKQMVLLPKKALKLLFLIYKLFLSWQEYKHYFVGIAQIVQGFLMLQGVRT